MDNTMLGINAARNLHLFDNGFLQMIKKPPTTMVDPNGNIIDDPILTNLPCDSSSGNTNQTAPNPVPFDAELMGLLGNRKALTFIECMCNTFESQTEDLWGQWEEATKKLMQENIHARSPTIQYCEKGKFMKCKDVIIKQMDYGIWDAEVVLMNQKGWNLSDNMACLLKYRLSAITKMHMLWFNTPSLLLLHLMQMGALKDCKVL
ncbi:chromosome partition [Rhizoctonia solani]|uniref:Chromosome partition n=1 Tax=Rhizoctonia solani TaxID=456999 RepID=A0A8H8NWH3_9AGAM|nr:chromosome partition [Rhizoctonia solani]QRW21391.1 chromosome partition [Rhizoctonia solani]